MKRILCLILLVLTLLPAQAGVFVINSAPYNDGTEYIGPYNSTYDGFSISSWCIDLNSQVGFGQPFEAQALNLSDYKPGTNDQSLLLEVGYLMLASVGATNNINELSDIQRAIWFLTTPNAESNPYLNTVDVHLWVDYAQGHPVQPTDFSLFTVYIKDGSGQNQMGFAGPIPEPRTWAIMAIGLVSLVGFNLRRAA